MQRHNVALDLDLELSYFLLLQKRPLDFPECIFPLLVPTIQLKRWLIFLHLPKEPLNAIRAMVSNLQHGRLLHHIVRLNTPKAAERSFEILHGEDDASVLCSSSSGLLESLYDSMEKLNCRDKVSNGDTEGDRHVDIDTGQTRSVPGLLSERCDFEDN